MEELVELFESKKLKIFEDLKWQECNLEKIKSFNLEVYKDLRIHWYFEDDFGQILDQFLNSDFENWRP